MGFEFWVIAEIMNEVFHYYEKEFQNERQIFICLNGLNFIRCLENECWNKV